MIINKFFIFCGLMFVLPIIYAAEFQIADTKIILPQINGYKIANEDVVQTITKVQNQECLTCVLITKKMQFIAT